MCPSLHPTSGLRVGALCKSDWAPYRGAQVDLLTTRLQPRLPIVYCTRTLLFVTRVCTCALSSSAGCWGWLPSGGWAGLSSPSSCACTHVVVDHPSGWSGAAGGVWTRPPRRLPTRGRICVRQRVCVKGFSLRVPSPFTLGASARTTYARYVRAYVRTDADVAVCVCLGGLVGYALRHTTDPSDPRSHTRPTTPSPTGQCPTKYCGFGLQATQPPVHKAPRAVELQPHTTASAQGTSGGPIRDVGVRGIIRDNRILKWN